MFPVAPAPDCSAMFVAFSIVDFRFSRIASRLALSAIRLSASSMASGKNTQGASSDAGPDAVLDLALGLVLDFGPRLEGDFPAALFDVRFAIAPFPTEHMAVSDQTGLRPLRSIFSIRG